MKQVSKEVHKSVYPTADLVEVVRYKDCKHCLINLKWNTALCMRTVCRASVPLDGFCSFGERKEAENK